MMPVDTGRLGLPLIDTVHCCRAEDLLCALPDASVDLIATDPPYFKVKMDQEWDRQWDTATEFIEWIGELCEQWRRVLKPNGSLYVFASPQMSARVEVEIGRWFHVLNHVVWMKPTSRHKQADKDIVRGYFPQTERIIFAEQGDADSIADEIAGFTAAEVALKKRIFGDYLVSEWKQAGVSYHDITGAIGAYREHNHGGAASNWALGYNCPTPEQYEKMRDYLNTNGSEYLRREYEDLRREYEDLRRPFNVSPDVPYTDVWTFATVGTYPGKHPAEKPIAMMEHIIKASSKPGAIVLDCFAGSGTTLKAAQIHGRHYIGCDMSAAYVATARQRLNPRFGGYAVASVTAAPLDDLPLFGGAMEGQHD